jgi:hypothetical protein
MQTAVSVAPASTAGNMTTVTGPGVLGGVGSTVSGAALLLLLLLLRCCCCCCCFFSFGYVPAML